METNRKNTNPKKAVIITIILLIILSNTPPAQFFLLENYGYTNADHSFSYSEEPGKGMDFEAGQIQFDAWKKQNPTNPNRTLYRTFKIKPWQFWEWWQYIAHPKRFTLPYKAPSD